MNIVPREGVLKEENGPLHVFCFIVRFPSWFLTGRELCSGCVSLNHILFSNPNLSLLNLSTCPLYITINLVISPGMKLTHQLFNIYTQELLTYFRGGSGL